jgi:AcrR family transcriptional regulator
MRLLSERDFDTVTIEMITEAADVGKGTFFNYFDNKEAVISYYFEKVFHRISGTLQPLAEPPDAAPTAPEEADSVWKHIVATMEQGAEDDSRNKRFTRTLLALTQTNDAVRAANLNVRRQLTQIGLELVRQGQARKELRDDVPPEILAAFLRDTYFSVLYAWALQDDGDTLLDMLRQRFTLLRSAIEPVKK